MKKIFYLFSTFIPLLMLSCTEPGESVVGSNQDRQITGLSFLVDTTFFEGPSNRLVAKGTVTNNSSNKITSPWYVEGQFYSDATFRIKLGGNYSQIGVPLSKGQSTFWTIYFSSTNVNVADYPNFQIGELRGIYK